MNIIDKNKALKDFFLAYAGDIEGSLNYMSEGELMDYLESDVFIGVASAATGINEKDFITYAIENVGELG